MRGADLAAVAAQTPDEATRLLQEYGRITRPTLRRHKQGRGLLASISSGGLPFTRYESAPGKAIIYARLKATVAPPGQGIVLLHHMDVVPAIARSGTRPLRGVLQATSCGARAME